MFQYIQYEQITFPEPEKRYDDRNFRIISHCIQKQLAMLCIDDR